MSAIRMAGQADRDVIHQLLSDSSLPTGDLTASTVHFLIEEVDGRVVGVIGLETFATDGLLRSLAVAGDFRHRGCGRRLVKALEDQARKSGLVRLSLLTQTAQAFFESLGYESVSRDAAPAALHGSAEFKSLCPQSAICMTRRI